MHARGSRCAAAARQARCESAVRGYAGAIYRHTVWKLQLELLLSVPLGRNFSGAQKRVASDFPETPNRGRARRTSGRARRVSVRRSRRWGRW